MALAMQVLTEAHIQEASFDVSFDVVGTGGRLTAPTKWKVVVHCIREAAAAGAQLVAALNSPTAERVFRKVAWKLVMQELVDAICAKPNAAVRSLQAVSPAVDRLPRRSPRLRERDGEQDANVGR